MQPKVFRVLVTGSRDWPHAFMIDAALELAVEDARSVMADMLLVRHGGASGADTMASNWVKANPVAQGRLPVAECIHYPAWNAYGKSAGHRRNSQMVFAGNDLCLAFIKDGSAGATGCLVAADQAGIKSLIWRL